MKSVRSLLFCHVGPCLRLIDVLASLVADDESSDEKAVPHTTTVMQQRAIVALNLVYLSAKKIHRYSLIYHVFFEFELKLELLGLTLLLQCALLKRCCLF